MGGTHLLLVVRPLIPIMRWQLPLCWCFCGSENQLRKRLPGTLALRVLMLKKIIPNVLKDGLTPVAESALVLPE